MPYDVLVPAALTFSTGFFSEKFTIPTAIAIGHPRIRTISVSSLAPLRLEDYALGAAFFE